MRAATYANRAIVGFGSVALILLVAGVVSSFVAIRDINRSTDDLAITSASIDQADNCLSGLRDVEAGGRGYVITGDLEFLEPYSSVLPNLSSICSQASASAAKSKNAAALVGLDQLVGARLAEMKIVVQQRRDGDLPGAMAGVASAKGKQIMDRIRLSLGQYIAAQQRVLQVQESDSASIMRDFVTLMIFLSCLALLLASVFVWLIIRDVRHRMDEQKSLNTERATQHTLSEQRHANEDLTRANDDLLASQENLDVTLNSIGDAVIATDTHGVIRRLNRTAETLSGWTAAEGIGRPIAEIFRIVNKTTRLPAIIPVADTIARGVATALANHTVLIGRDGREHDIADSCAPIRDHQNNIIGAVLVFRDVTAEYRLQQTAADATARVQAVLATAADGIVTFNAQGGVIESANTAALFMFGYTEADIVGQVFSILIPELGDDLHDGSLAYYVASHAGLTSGLGREASGVRRDGTAFPLELSVSEFVSSGNRFFTAMLRDNTIRKQVEAERGALDLALQNKSLEFEAATKAAEKANQAKSDFLSNMSHELRTPLGAILGFAQLLESASPPPSATQARSIGQILKAGWFLLDLINEILDLAQIESGHITLSLEPTALGKLLTDCQSMVEPQAALKNIKISLPALAASLYVRADWTRLKQVIVNLLSNSIKYNRPGGTVVVHVHVGQPVPAAQREKNGATVGMLNQVRISVTDNGFGISAENLANLFQPFNRLGQESSAEVGTGIGLVVCRELVQKMGGRIGVESSVGVGSTFWVELPHADAPLAHGDEATDTGGHTGGVRALSATEASPSSVATAEPRFRLLYIEDNPANLMLVEDLLARRPDIRLLTAVDADSGIAIARATLPNAILMDINLPGTSGIQAMEILSADASTAHIPVMALSANAMPRDIERGLQAGFYRYLTKPIKVNKLMAALDEALNRNPTDSEKL